VALARGLVDRVVPPGGARAAAEALASELSALPQGCLRSDRAATLDQLESPLPLPQALEREFAHGLETLKSGESLAGAARFSSGAFRHGERK
jgi:enoyl-CoA hydratase